MMTRHGADVFSSTVLGASWPFQSGSTFLVVGTFLNNFISYFPLCFPFHGVSSIWRIHLRSGPPVFLSFSWWPSPLVLLLYFLGESRLCLHNPFTESITSAEKFFNSKEPLWLFSLLFLFSDAVFPGSSQGSLITGFPTFLGSLCFLHSLILDCCAFELHLWSPGLTPGAGGPWLVCLCVSLGKKRGDWELDAGGRGAMDSNIAFWSLVFPREASFQLPACGRFLTTKVWGSGLCKQAGASAFAFTSSFLARYLCSQLQLEPAAQRSSEGEWASRPMQCWLLGQALDAVGRKGFGISHQLVFDFSPLIVPLPEVLGASGGLQQRKPAAWIASQIHQVHCHMAICFPAYSSAVFSSPAPPVLVCLWFKKKIIPLLKLLWGSKEEKIDVCV